MLDGTSYKELGCSNPDKTLTNTFTPIENSRLCELAEESEYVGKGSAMHDTVQNYLIQKDPSTIAVEVPVYDEERSGFIDIVRFVNGRIQILDFKPNAHKENHFKVLTQLTHYRKLLAKKLEASEFLFDCGYFDKDNFYLLIN